MIKTTTCRFEPLPDERLYRSSFERQVAADLMHRGIDFQYEGERIPFVHPARKATYTPDFTIGNLIVETKGLFTAQDRKKMLQVKEQHPDKDIRMLFQRAANRLSKGSPTTYGAWCDKNGIKWAQGSSIPAEWIREAGSHGYIKTE